jgi:hypothetical protein
VALSGSWAELLLRVLSGRADRNIRFAELVGLLTRLGFDERIRGDHHIFTRSGGEEIINLQPSPGGLAKPYQVRQARSIIVRYKLDGENEP